MGDASNLVLSWRTVMMTMACLPLVIAAVILTFRKAEQPASRYLAALLLACVFEMGPQIIGYAGFYDVWPGLTFFPFSTELWIGPLFYLHGYKLMQGGPLGWRKYLLAPGILQTTYYTWAFLFLGDYKNKWEYNGRIHDPVITPVETLLGIGLIVFAVLAVWRIIKTYRMFLETTQSAALDFDPIWLRRMIVAMGIGGLLYTGLEAATLIKPISYNAAFPIQVAVILVMVWLSVEAVWRLRESFPKIINFASQSSRNPSSQKDWDQEAKIVKGRVLAEKWYLEPRFSIRDLADRLATNESYVSRSLNQGLGQTFNAFINGLRVEHAKALIAEGKGGLLTIALDSGFNSKATFNRVFRDMTGQTPSAFKSQKTSQNP